MRSCGFPGCERLYRAKGYCELHARQLRTRGWVGPARVVTAKDVPISQRLAKWTEKGAGCWLWTGYLDPYGYGALTVNGKRQKAHRLAYENAYGSIPDGMVIDHMCFRRDCVRPDHMRAVTRAENTANREGAASHSATGVRGVLFMRGAYWAQVGKGGKTFREGPFADIDEAARNVRRMRQRILPASLMDIER